MKKIINTYGGLRKKARTFLLDILSNKSVPNPGIHILNGHFLSFDEHAPSKIFLDQLKMLKANGITFINFDQAVRLIERQTFPAKKCLVAFTFDDGFEDCHTKIIPILNEIGIKAGFFINPGFIDGEETYKKMFKEKIVLTDKNPMSWNEIKIIMKEGHIIGAHTIDHLMLNINDKNALEYQIGECKKIIEKKIGNKCDYFAFPYGKMNQISETAISIAEKYFKYIFSQSNYRHYYSYGTKVINRRHFECDWPYKHVIYFLKEKTL